jgi:hypothetical protein
MSGTNEVTGGDGMSAKPELFAAELRAAFSSLR